MGRIRIHVLPLRGLLALLLALALFALGVGGARPGAPAPAAGTAAAGAGLGIGDAAPDFTLHDLEGTPVTLSAFRGRPVVLFFWAGWCGQCLASFPELAALAARYEQEGLAVLAVNIMQTAEQVAALRAEHGLGMPLLLDEDAAVTNGYGVRVTPAFYFIGRDGTVRGRISGAPRPGQLEGAVQRIMRLGAGASPPG